MKKSLSYLKRIILDVGFSLHVETSGIDFNGIENQRTDSLLGLLIQLLKKKQEATHTFKPTARFPPEL